MNYERGTCSNCQNPSSIIVNRTHWLCSTCNNIRLEFNKGNGKSAARLTPITPDKSFGKPGRYSNAASKPKKKKPTGEALMFLIIAQEKPHVCFVCGEPIRPITYASCAHVLAKGKYPKFRLYAKNVVFLCSPFDGCRAHHRYDFEPHSELISLPEWKPLFELRDLLLEEYKKLEQQ